MKKSKRMTSIADVAHGREREAARQMTECLRTLEVKQRRLCELESFLKEYSEQFNLISAAGSPVATVQRYRIFMGKLDAIINHQRAIVETGRRQCEEIREQWSTHRRKSKVMDKVVEGHARRELHEAERLEQNEMDDLVGRGKQGQDAD